MATTLTQHADASGCLPAADTPRACPDGSTQPLSRHEIGALLNRIGRELREPPTDAFLSLDLSMAQLKTLLYTYYHGPATVGQIAAALGVTLSTASGTIDKLARHAFVERLQEPTDRRLVLNRVAPAGAAIVERLREDRRTRIQQVLAHVSADDLELVARALAVLARAVDSVPPICPPPEPSAPHPIATVSRP